MAWDSNASSTLISAIISTILATIASVIITKKTIRNQDESQLHEEILQVNMVAMEYPFIVDEMFCKKYDAAITTDEMLRYDCYCCILFNLLQKIWQHFDGKISAISSFYGYEEEIMRNKEWWLSKKNRKEIIQGHL